MPEFLNTAMGALPAAANHVTATSGSANVYGAWVQLAAAAPSDIAITGVTMHPGGFSPQVYFIVNIGYGAAGAEVSFSEFTGWLAMASGTWSPENSANVIPALIPVETITSGTRVAARVMRGDSSNGIGVATTYVAFPLTGGGDLETTTLPLRTSGSLSVTAGGSAWANGSWTQWEAATADDYVINHIVTRGATGTAGYMEIGLGTGAAGAETEISAFASHWPTGTGNNTAPQVTPMGILFDNIASGVRTAIRSRDETASQTRTIRFGYYHK